MKFTFPPNKGQVFFIAEAGVNHNGSLENAFKLVDIASDAGADAIKFQTFVSGECTGRFAVKVDYLEGSTSGDKSRYEITEDLIMPFEDFVKIRDYCDEKGITFLSTPDGKESLDFVADVLRSPIIKIASTEVTNLKFLEQIAQKERPIIFSTGMSYLSEIEIGLNAMLKYNDNISILHCTSEYPAPKNEINLRAIKTIKNAFNLPVGYSDHTLGNEACVAAVALGAVILEKHFTIDKSMPGPDHKASMDPDELKDLLIKIRNTESMLGDGVKKPTLSESKNMDGIRRSVVAAEDIPANTVLTAEHLTCKRPGSGIHPYDIDKLIGLKVNRDLQWDEPIKWEDLN